MLFTRKFQAQFEKNFFLLSFGLLVTAVMLAIVVVIVDLTKDPFVISADKKVVLRNEMKQPDVVFTKSSKPEPLVLKRTDSI